MKIIKGKRDVLANEELDELDELDEDISDLDVEDVQPDEPSIDVDNNIADHYIAECDACKGVFIAATTVTEHQVFTIEGVCPLCDAESIQRLGWIIKEVE